MKSKDLKPAEVTTLVLNGTTIAGSRDTSFKLALAGFHTLQLPATVSANAPSRTYSATTVYFDWVQGHAKQAAAQLRRDGLAHERHTADATPRTYAQQAGNPLDDCRRRRGLRRRARESGRRTSLQAPRTRRRRS